jgi:protein O-mannosyl-transferase
MARRGLSSVRLQTHLRAIFEYERRNPGRFYLLLSVALALVVYAPTLGYGLVGYDDTWLIKDNWIVQEPSWGSLRTIFFELDVEKRLTLAPEYLPIRDMSVMLDYWVWHGWYPGFHLTNLALYVAAIIVWFIALDGFGIDRRLVGLALLLWAVHPTHAESVAWLAERKGLLAIAFSGVVAIGFTRFRAGGRVAWLIIAVLASVLAVWSKAHAAFAIGSIAALELVLPARRVSWRRSLLGLAAIGIVAIAAFIPVMLLAKSSAVLGVPAVAAERVETVFGVHGFYVQRALMVHASSVSYPIALAGPTMIDIALGVVGLAVALGALVAPPGWRWSPPAPVRAGVALWLVGWLPVSHLIVPLRMVIVADRYVLFPTLGFALVLSAAVSRIASNRGRAALLITIVAASMLRTYDAQTTWKDGESLWERAATVNPNDGGAWSMYAEAVATKGEPDRALAIVAEGRKHSNEPRLLMREALLSIELGDRTYGVSLMREAATAGEYRAMTNLALLLLADGAKQEALDWARRSVQRVPSYANGQRILGKVALEVGRADEARIAFEHAFALEPHNLTNRFNLALALMALDRRAEARVHLQACLADPSLRARAQTLLQ